MRRTRLDKLIKSVAICTKSMGLQQSKLRNEPLSSMYDSLPQDWPWVWGMRDAENLDWKKGLSETEIIAQAEYQSDLPVSITPKIYLGNAQSVSILYNLQERGIDAVLNMAGPNAVSTETKKAYQEHGIVYKEIDAKDQDDYKLLDKHWKESYEFIKEQVHQGKKCVVHCVAGLNRSALIVSSYFMVTTRCTVLESAKHLRAQRGNHALCNEGFQEQLVALARKQNLLGPPPGTNGSVVPKVPAPPYPTQNDWMV